MRFKPSPADFTVEEIVRLPATSSGAYTIYRVQKRGITTLQVQERLAAALNVPRSAVAFPALKDKEAQSTQYGTVRGDGPAQVTGQGFYAERLGRSTRPFSARDLLGNRFTAVLHALSAQQVEAIPAQLARLERYGFPNYFDQQRFGSYALQAAGEPGQDMPGKRILLRDAEGALHAHLAQPFVGDPPRVREFKRVAQQHWGEWRYLLQAAPKPSNFRSVLTFLVDHPQDYRKALNLVTPRLLSLYLAAYQSLLWNRLAARYLAQQLQQNGMSSAGTILVAGEELPFYAELPPPLLQHLQNALLPFFQQRMTIADPKLARLSEAILAEEGLAHEQLKARLLQRAYLTRGTRPLLAFPRETVLDTATADRSTAGRYKRTISFVLPPGSYATLMLKWLAMQSDSDTKNRKGQTFSKESTTDAQRQTGSTMH